MTNQEHKNRENMTDADIADELKFCVDVGQNLFNQLIKDTNGDGPRVILSASILLVALCEGKEGVLETILQGVDILEAKVAVAKMAMMAQARQSPIN